MWQIDKKKKKSSKEEDEKKEHHPDNEHNFDEDLTDNEFYEIMEDD